MIRIFLVVFVLFTGVEGLYGSIDDITNNLASDLAPLITLFGEEATKQFLSESTSIMDSVIFSIAPLGLITAVVSVIRIYGSSSFKSIIGRSQEAHGVAEAELCSSTSQDVCELWSNGGICRVFGRPKILDFLYYNTNAKDDFYPRYKKDQRQDIVEEGPSCGIYRPHTLFIRNDEEMRTKMNLFGWKEVRSDRWTWPKWLTRLLRIKPDDPKTEDEPFVNPNLTLNIGIRQFHKWIHWSVLIFSVLLQLSFFGYATWATFYNPSSLNEGTPTSQAKIWFGLTILGTIMLVFGMILCARLIDLKSRERTFKRSRGMSEIFWLQPGGQRIGDQLFHAFAYSDPSKDDYIISGRVENTKRERTLLLAVISTCSGWVLQFVGLRGSPGSIALFQFIATLIMSFLRAVLRGKRLGAENNRLESQIYKEGSLIEGHELDWQAMNIDKNDQHSVTEWHVSDHFPNEDKEDVKEELPDGVTVKATKHFRAYYTSDDDRITHAANSASDWIASQEAINSDSPLPLSSEEANDVLPLQRKHNNRACAACINPAAKIMRFRSRLAEMTGVQFGLPLEQAWGGEIRTAALQLQKALQASAEYLFAQFPLEQAWKSNTAPKAIAWKSSCRFSQLRGKTSTEVHYTIAYQMYNRDGKWSISNHQIEAVLGLWLWSLKQSELRTGHKAEEQLIRSKMIAVESSKTDDTKSALYRWVTQTRQIRDYGTVGGISRADKLSIPTPSLLARAQSSKQSSGALGKPYAPKTDEFTILGIPTTGTTSLLQLMAQDVYTVFINRIVDVVGDLGGTGDPEGYLTMRGHSLSTTSRATQLLELTNPHIDALANALVSAGVATREEALMSIVPAFLRQKKLPVLYEDMAQDLLDWAKSLRRGLKFREGAALITWMLSSCPEGFHKLGVRCLGDLYRRAALSKKKSDQEFGLSGMREMNTRHSALASDSQIQDILGCYERLYAPKTPKVAYEDSCARKIIKDDLKDLRKSKEQGIEVAIRHQAFETALTLCERVYFSSRPGFSMTVLEILEWAIYKNFPELIEDLWMSGSSPQEIGKQSPLLFALNRKCELETFHSLLDWPGMDINAGHEKSGLGDKLRTPLICAIDFNRADVVRSILRRGAAVDRRDKSPCQMTPLHHASQSSNMKTIQLLLEKGANVHERAASGQKALHFAAGANIVAVIQILLENGAKVDERDTMGRTPLHYAAKANKKGVIQFLLENGADVHEKDHQGQTPLHYAAATNNEDVIQFLLENGAKVHEKDRRGQTPLHYAVSQANSKAVVRRLLENSAEVVNEKDKSGRTPLHLAIAHRESEKGKELPRLLLEKGAGIDEKEERGRTPLHLAVAHLSREKRVGFTRLLLEKGADIYEEDVEGRTALHVAVQRNYPSILRLLLGKNAENGHTGHRDWSSLWSVIRKNDKEMVQLLEEKDIKKPLRSRR